MDGSKRRTRRWRPALLVLLASALATAGAGCVQEIALEPVATVVGGRIGTDPAGGNVVGVRVNMVGTSTDQVPATSDYTFCDVEGDFTLKTQRLGRGWVVARGVEYDIGYDNVYLKEFGSQDSVDRLIPATDTVTLFKKKAGEALFVVFEQDFGPFESCHLVGDFNDFKMDSEARALHDDGSLFDIDPGKDGKQVSGDYEAGDGVWTLRTELPSGEQHYGFVFDQNGDDIRRDPYEEKDDKASATDRHESVILVK